jgi:putative ABC transport system permease protein
MWFNYFKIAIRNILRNKFRSLLHLLGLSLGIGICALIFNLVWYAHSFDKFHVDADRIFRITTLTEWEPGIPFESSGTNGPLGEVIDQELAAIALKGKLYVLHNVMVSIPEGEKVIGRNNKVAFADPGFFKIFQREWLAGNPETALMEPYSAVITAQSMERYFPGLTADQVLGKEVTWIDADTVSAQINGVVANYEANTDFYFTDFISFSTISQAQKEDWYGLHSWSNINSANQLFVKAQTGTSLEKLNEDLKSIAQKYLKEENQTTFKAEPLSNIHFSGNFDDTTISLTLLNSLIYIGLIILLLACLNFVNLETALAINRAKEVGIRKTLGSNRLNLILQFLSETFVLVIIASLISLLVSHQIRLYFSSYFPSGFVLNIFGQANILFLAAIAVTITIISGFYPGLILSRYEPQRALKGELHGPRGFSIGVFLRKNLTILQFSVSMAFIIMVAVVSHQLKYIYSQPLGFEKEAVLYVELPFMGDRMIREQLAEKIRAEGIVEGVSLSGNLSTSSSLWTSDAYALVSEVEKPLNVHVMNVDSAFVQVNGIRILAGGTFHSNAEILVNLNFIKEIGLEDPNEAIGTSVRVGGEQRKITGVINNFNANSLKEQILPMVLLTSPNFHSLLIAKVTSGQNLSYSKSVLEKLYKETYPYESAEFQFMDTELERFYEDDKKIQGILGFSSTLAIILSALGLFGLSSFAIAQRTKEISIRKVLGANIAQLIRLVTIQYAWLVFIAFALAAYPAYYFSEQWLQGFAYRIDMPYFTYAAVGFGMLLLAMGIVIFHSLKIAIANPAEILKRE